MTTQKKIELATQIYNTVKGYHEKKIAKHQMKISKARLKWVKRIQALKKDK